MSRRFVAITFPHLITDWWTLRRPEWKDQPLVVCAPAHGRLIITAVNPIARNEGIHIGMVLADARALQPQIQVINEQTSLQERLLKKLAEWCILFTPVTAIDLPGGLILDVKGCAHLWGGDKPYLSTIINRLSARGYIVRAAMADTIGTAWALSRYASQPIVVPAGESSRTLLSLPPEALRLDQETTERLHKLGLKSIGDFIHMPKTVLFRRFGSLLLKRISQALGTEEEYIEPFQVPPLYFERLPCLEPITTAAGIHIALQKLIEKICERLKNEQLGIRKVYFKCYRADNKVEQIEAGTNRPSSNPIHILKLMQEKVENISPGPGIELFICEVPQVENNIPRQDKLWESAGALHDHRLSELVDRLSLKLGANAIQRFLPAEHYWPERSFKKIDHFLQLSEEANWRNGRSRPVHLLPNPIPVQVAAPIPDYPPMHFRYNGKLHKVVKADGPERIEQEWWIQSGLHRDYYKVEDESGNRYWLFRAGHYEAENSARWFLHGFFA